MTITDKERGMDEPVASAPLKEEDMVRRIALAICRSRTCEGINCCQWPANIGRRNCNAKAGAYDDAARDTLSAMRAPTAAMTEQFIGGQYGIYGDVEATAIWRKMIDFALQATRSGAAPHD